jgi:hypothetical protein
MGTRWAYVSAMLDFVKLIMFTSVQKGIVDGDAAWVPAKAHGACVFEVPNFELRLAKKDGKGPKLLRTSNIIKACTVTKNLPLKKLHVPCSKYKLPLWPMSNNRSSKYKMQPLAHEQQSKFEVQDATFGP